MVRRSAVKARTQTVNQIKSLVVTAPEQLREHLRGLGLSALVHACARFRPGSTLADPAVATKGRAALARAPLRNVDRRNHRGGQDPPRASGGGRADVARAARSRSRGGRAAARDRRRQPRPSAIRGRFRPSYVVSHRYRQAPGERTATASTAAAIEAPTMPYTPSS
jgi:hypothetical protein